MVLTHCYNEGHHLMNSTKFTNWNEQWYLGKGIELSSNIKAN